LSARARGHRAVSAGNGRRSAWRGKLQLRPVGTPCRRCRTAGASSARCRGSGALAAMRDRVRGSTAQSS
jgi:hypothetical protein